MKRNSAVSEMLSRFIILPKVSFFSMAGFIVLMFAMSLTVSAADPGVSYRTHVQNIGWQNYVKNGAAAGTTGKSYRLEAINLKLENQPYSGSIQYKTHIQNIGWENSWKSNGAMSGTSGRALRLEAIQIRLTGNMAKNYNIYYRVHAQNIGWMGWACNGQKAGTAGYSYRLEGIQVRLIRKGLGAPGKMSDYYRQIDVRAMYDSYIKSKGFSSLKRKYVDIDKNGVQELLLVGPKTNPYAIVCTVDRGKRTVIELMKTMDGRVYGNIFYNTTTHVFGTEIVASRAAYCDFYKLSGTKAALFKQFVKEMTYYYVNNQSLSQSAYTNQLMAMKNSCAVFAYG